MQARDGINALHIYKKNNNQIHLILMDIYMPKMDGITASKVIKETHPFPRIILMSGSADKISAQVDGFLSKPFKIDDLYEKVQQTLRIA